jgi:hypothetical protein
MPGRMPEKKPFGRQDPPRSYPTDLELYADPQNWMYPLDKPIRARLARRYFDELRNRSKYTEQERLFIDSRIDEALRRFGVDSNTIQAGHPVSIMKRRSPPRISADDVTRSSLEELLQRFLGASRLERAKSIPDNLVSLSGQDGEMIYGKVKQYLVTIDVKRRTITHDCDDWKRNMRSRLMCKHLGKVFLTLRNREATALLRQILLERDHWVFGAP